MMLSNMISPYLHNLLIINISYFVIKAIQIMLCLVIKLVYSMLPFILGFMILLECILIFVLIPLVFGIFIR